MSGKDEAWAVAFDVTQRPGWRSLGTKLTATISSKIRNFSGRQGVSHGQKYCVYNYKGDPGCSRYVSVTMGVLVEFAISSMRVSFEFA